MNTRFTSSKSVWISSLIFIVIGLMIVVIGSVFFKELSLKPETFIVVTLAGLVVFLLVWIWYGTYYLIVQNKLIVRSGPFCWTINIDDIRSIKTNQNTLSGINKATLSTKGVELRYGKYKLLMISPLQETKFIEKLKEINNKIEIK